MLIAFKSPAAPEIVMTEQLAQYLLGLLGKELGVRGVIHHDGMGAAITRLEAAVAHEKERTLPHSTHYLGASDDSLPQDSVGLAQRAYPLLDMMRHAHEQNADILWGV